MKNLKARSGPFSERPFYEHDEIDEMCIDELHKAGLYPITPSPDNALTNSYRAVHRKTVRRYSEI
jgi:hypothetical protein